MAQPYAAMFIEEIVLSTAIVWDVQTFNLGQIRLNAEANIRNSTYLRLLRALYRNFIIRTIYASFDDGCHDTDTAVEYLVQNVWIWKVLVNEADKRSRNIRVNISIVWRVQPKWCFLLCSSVCDLLVDHSTHIGDVHGLNWTGLEIFNYLDVTFNLSTEKFYSGYKKPDKFHPSIFPSVRSPSAIKHLQYLLL